MSQKIEISNIIAREILDSRGFPTIATTVTSTLGISAEFSVPSGASTGALEALELRDQGSSRYHGKGVLLAISNVNNELRAKLKGMDASDQHKIDHLLIEADGTKNKSRLGANAILSVSLACAKLAAKQRQEPLFAYLSGLMGNQSLLLPTPQMNIINGGAHADNEIDFQEFMIIPHGAGTFREALRYGAEIFHTLKYVLSSKGLSTNVGDEGGFAPMCRSNAEAIDLIMQAIEKAGYRPGEDVSIGLDVASSEFYKDGRYFLAAEKTQLGSDDMIDFLQGWVERYPIISIEDALAESDWSGWENLTRKLGSKVQLTGDDLFVTNCDLLSKGIQLNAANSILIKFNQIGTLTETLDAIKMAKNANFGVTVSHRSGETEDTTISDLAVGSSSGQIKTGSISRSDRISKYNRLLKIEDELGDLAVYAGSAPFSL